MLLKITVRDPFLTETSFSCMKVLTSISSLPTLCLIVPTVFSYTWADTQNSAIVRWKSVLTQSWVTLWHHISPSQLNTKGREASGANPLSLCPVQTGGSEMLIDNLTLSGEVWPTPTHPPSWTGAWFSHLRLFSLFKNRLWLLAKTEIQEDIT